MLFETASLQELYGNSFLFDKLKNFRGLKMMLEDDLIENATAEERQ